MKLFLLENDISILVRYTLFPVLMQCMYEGCKYCTNFNIAESERCKKSAGKKAPPLLSIADIFMTESNYPNWNLLGQYVLLEYENS